MVRQDELTVDMAQPTVDRTMAPQCKALFLVLLWLLLAPGCSGPDEQRRPAPRPDPSLRALDRILTRGQPAPTTTAPEAADPGRCALQAARASQCPTPAGGRTYRLRLALDQRYGSRWPRWRARLAATVDCVNQLYAASGTRFEVQSLEDWDPGARRHDLHHLLTRVQREYPADGKTLAVGITVWDERRVYATSGGEIGLSQAAACVVPSWPRVENDCVILAHELGHLVGARHVPGKRWVMGWSARPFHLPAADPVARVVATYRFHPRNVDSLKLHHGAALTPHGLRLTRPCRQRVHALDRCWSLR